MLLTCMNQLSKPRYQFDREISVDFQISQPSILGLMVSEMMSKAFVVFFIVFLYLKIKEISLLTYAK